MIATTTVSGNCSGGGNTTSASSKDNKKIKQWLQHWQGCSDCNSKSKIHKEKATINRQLAAMAMATIAASSNHNGISIGDMATTATATFEKINHSSKLKNETTINWWQ